MATVPVLDAAAALMATVVIAQSLTLGAIQCLRIHDGRLQGAAAGLQAHRQGWPAPQGLASPGRWLLLTLLLAAVVAFGDLLQHLGLSRLEHWLSPVHGAALLLVGPAMWFYALAITRLPGEAPPGMRGFGWHAVPAVMIAAVAAVAVLLDPRPASPAGGQRTTAELVVLVPVAAQILLYLAAVVRRVRQLRPLLEARFSRVQHRQLRWLEAAAWTFALLVLVWMASWTLPVAVSNIMTNGLLAVDVAVLGVFGARQRNVFAASPWMGEDPCPQAMAPAVPQPPAGEESPATKYAKSAVPEALAAEIAERLARHVERDRPYLACDLTLGELAAAVKATPHQLSQVLSTRLEATFFDYVNGLRVDAVKATLVRPQAAGRPLLEIALECGFGSKSAFNEAFKRATGMSPSAYRKSLPASAVAVPAAAAGNRPAAPAV